MSQKMVFQKLLLIPKEQQSTLLFGGTDPIITKNEEKQKFNSYEADYFGEDVISNYFTYEDVTLRKKVKIDDGTGLKEL